MSTAPLDRWRGQFGDEYSSRNRPTEASVQSLVRSWAKILERTWNVGSILEAGANVGLNLRALRRLTDAELWAVEPNDGARQRLVADEVVPADRALAGDLRQLPVDDGAVDLAFTRGVLIHVPPDELHQALRELHRASRRWLVVQEYFAPSEEVIEYRGHSDMLWRRDYGGELLDLFPDLQPVDQGFLWSRTTGQDNLTWWLFQKPVPA